MDNLFHKKGKSITMDNKKVHALLLAIEKGSLTSAAAELGYTQSGLTHMMADHFCARKFPIVYHKFRACEPFSPMV